MASFSSAAWIGIFSGSGSGLANSVNNEYRMFSAVWLIKNGSATN